MMADTVRYVEWDSYIIDGSYYQNQYPVHNRKIELFTYVFEDHNNMFRTNKTSSILERTQSFQINRIGLSLAFSNYECYELACQSFLKLYINGKCWQQIHTQEFLDKSLADDHMKEHDNAPINNDIAYWSNNRPMFGVVQDGKMVVYEQHKDAGYDEPVIVLDQVSNRHRKVAFCSSIEIFPKLEIPGNSTYTVDMNIPNKLGRIFSNEVKKKSEGFFAEIRVFLIGKKQRL